MIYEQDAPSDLRVDASPPRRTRSVMSQHVVLFVLGVVAIFGCRSSTDVLSNPTVDYLIDAPLCSSVIPVEFLIDGTQVGADTFLVNLGTSHTRSRTFPTAAGEHTISARTGSYSWPAKTLMMRSRQAYTDTLPFYCS